MYRLISRESENLYQQKIIQQLKSRCADIDSVDVYSEYYVQSPLLPEAGQQKLNTILDAEPFQENQYTDFDQVVWVTPRIGTYSSWGSKALDILHMSGLNDIVRIEKGLAYCLKFKNNNQFVKTAELQDLLYDRMVESLILEEGTLKGLFESTSPARSIEINIQKEGVAALQAANTTLGLALSTQEIDFLYQSFSALDRNPLDVELMMFAQINSEHCRHKVFNAAWQIDGEAKPDSLFQMIKNTYRVSPSHVLSAYKDNASVIQSFATDLFGCDSKNQYQFEKTNTHILMKVETHNHPTAIEPFAGSGTGQGGEIRDEGATGRGSEPKAGLTGFTVSNLNVPGYQMSWETTSYVPDRIQNALQIMIKAPIGGAAFNNEFGRPNICGYFRTYEHVMEDTEQRYQAFGFHKPIMIAGGMGSIQERNIQKQSICAGDLIIVLGGPAMKIGIGGGSASSMGQGQSDAQLDFASVQRQNPEMQRRAQEVISTLSRASVNIIKSIHDVGAGGIANAISEIVHDSGLGVNIDLSHVPIADSSMSPLEMMCNESQERYILAISFDQITAFTEIAKRERCPFAVVGKATAEPVIEAYDPRDDLTPVALPTRVLFADPPKLQKVLARSPLAQSVIKTDFNLAECLHNVLRAPAVADKSFLITIGDRSVTGLVARDQMVGPWQVPVADCAVTASSYHTHTGEAMAMGEKPALALIDPKAMARMSITESLLNILAADVAQLGDIKLSCNWMADAKTEHQAIALYDAVEAVGLEFCPALGIAVPVGKDSMSMKTAWQTENKQHEVLSPATLIVSAFAPVKDITKTLTPLLTQDANSLIVLIDLADKQQRLGGSIFAQVTRQIGDQCPDVHAAKMIGFAKALRRLKDKQLILAYHDKSDGGMWAALCEMAFAGHVGLDICLDQYAESEHQALQALLNEEAGVLLQIREQDLPVIQEILNAFELSGDLYTVARLNASQSVTISYQQQVIFTEQRCALHRIWSELSYRIQSMRDNEACALAQYEMVMQADEPGMTLAVSKQLNSKLNMNQRVTASEKRPKAAILREQGINGHREMAAAFTLAGLDAYDVTMQDLIEGRQSLDAFQMLVACGGFSFGDVLGAGRGWANAILHVDELRETFQQFFARPDTLTLGVCNGCQMLSQLTEIIPGAQHWPAFKRNQSEQFEARLSLVEIAASPSILLQGMQGLKLPIAVAHGEGQAVFQNCDYTQLKDANLCALRYIDHQGKVTSTYPYNPNGSVEGLTGLTTTDGRVTIMMPHPERVIKTWQMSWYPSEWDACEMQGYTPWMQLFLNAREWLNKQC